MKDELRNALNRVAATLPKQDATQAEAPYTRLDGIVNEIAGFGNAHDRTAFNHWRPTGQRFGDSQLADMFANDDMARISVSCRPFECTREGWCIVIPGDGNESQGAEIDQAADDDRLRFTQVAYEAQTFANLFGGALVIMGVRDGQDPSRPINEQAIEALDWLMVVDRRLCQPGPDITDVNDPAFGKPESYWFTPAGTSMGSQPMLKIHHSRVVRFDGALTTWDKKMANGGWSDSVIQACYDTLIDFQMAFKATSIGMSEWHQGVIKIKGLIDMIASNSGQKTMSARTQIMNLGRSVARALLLDADAEDYQQHEKSFGGVALILDRMMMRLSAALQIPVSILMGRSPAGLNATGDADIRRFYDTIRTEQEQKLAPRLRRLYRVLMLSKNGPTGGLEPEGWSIKFNPLWQQSPLEEAQEQQARAATDVLYLDAGVVSEIEVALSRFTSEGFGRTINIDRAARIALQAERGKEEKPQKPLLNPSDMVNVVLVNEARASAGLPPLPGDEGNVTIAEFMAAATAPPPLEETGTIPPTAPPADEFQDTEDDETPDDS